MYNINKGKIIIVLLTVFFAQFLCRVSWRLEKDPNAYLLLHEGVVAGELLMLGLEYSKNGGRDNDYTKYMKQQWKKALGLTIPPEVLIQANKVIK